MNNCRDLLKSGIREEASFLCQERSMPSCKKQQKGGKTFALNLLKIRHATFLSSPRRGRPRCGTLQKGGETFALDLLFLGRASPQRTALQYKKGGQKEGIHSGRKHLFRSSERSMPFRRKSAHLLKELSANKIHRSMKRLGE